MRASRGGGQIETIQSRTIDPSDIAVQPGYKIEPVISNLTFPTAVAFDDNNEMYVIEAGYSWWRGWDRSFYQRKYCTAVYQKVAGPAWSGGNAIF